MEVMLEKKTEDVDSTASYQEEIQKKLGVLREITETKIEEAQQRQRQTCDRATGSIREYKESDMVSLPPASQEGTVSKVVQTVQGTLRCAQSE